MIPAIQRTTGVNRKTIYKYIEKVLTLGPDEALKDAHRQPKEPTIIVSVDEKPGVQAIKNVAPDLPPIPGKHPHVKRDYEYKRLGTVSILAALDLPTGQVIAQVHDRHRSKEFVGLLKELDAYYPYSEARLVAQFGRNIIW